MKKPLLTTKTSARMDRTKWNAYMREWNNKFRRSIVELLGGKCVKCGFVDIRALQVDHIKGGGMEEHRQYRSRTKYWKMVITSIIADEGKYQLLCANCNWIKRSENKEL